jgi:aerobic-type carbon monoxide dehydrogenase small subunit (CoxS/CutS family)
MMNAAAFLQSNPGASDSDIIDAQQGNICRCGTYVRIKSAIRKAADMMQEV